jgi:hypothetical protein
MAEDHTGDVVLHNTMRFDVQLAHVQPMIDDGDVDVAQLAERIREAIIGQLDDDISIGHGWDLRQQVFVRVAKASRMLHRETITVDLS